MVRRIAIVEKDKCNPQGCGNYLCIRLCPVNRAGDECIVKADATEQFKAKIYAETCTGCGICPKRCPFGAIHIINLPEALDKDPIHRFNQNGFELFSLPTPIFGKVIGLIGINGIGKSTAIKILSGHIKPNFGDFKSKEFSYEKLIDYFKGTEAQKFFEGVRDKKIVVSYKPQEVDLIPKHSTGKVIDLLKKVDEKSMIAEISKKLDIENILQRDIKDISGGELQRVAIAACILKKANLYIFDELTSFLDIKQRMNAAKIIKELADENTAVLVIEHDLITLDYMTDLVHVMFGEAGAYGVVSLPKSSKEGINEYLDGFLRQENMRFRSYPIKFEIRSSIKAKHEKFLTSWNNVVKTQGDFSLRIKEGGISRNEIVGIVGENGTGKTTFARILSGETTPDSGEIVSKVKISYKPQYIDTESTELVMDVLHDTVKKYNSELIHPLSITTLLQKQINQLSGGELQRVAIAKCLTEQADVYLLDEPSAYLDVEQRLTISKIIVNLAYTRGISFMIIDHDLLFLDYLSQRLLVFLGTPSYEGNASGPYHMEDGMNMLLKEMNISFRREMSSGRPRMNKLDSQLDKEQKSSGKLYYG